ncbi:hypothetical protein JCM10212_003033 [Sporobolomyces blumeae]
MGKRAHRDPDDGEWAPAPRVSRRPSSFRPTTTEPDSSDNDSTRSSSTKRAGEVASGGTRKGGRTRVACDQCSRRRSRCNLEGPACDGCTKRGEGETCSYQALLWIEDVETLPSRQLRRKLDALEAFIGSLPSVVPVPLTPKSPTAVTSSPSPPGSEAPDLPANSVPTPHVAARNSLARSLFVNANLSDVIVPGVDPARLDYELRRIETSHILSKRRPDPTAPTSLPTHAQAHLAICFYSSNLNPVFRLVHEPWFFRDCQAFWSSGVVPSPTWLALYFATCAAGFKVASEEAGAQVGLKEGELAILGDKCWQEARQVLESEGFPLASSIEHVQIAILLALSSLHGDDYNVSRASALISTASMAALDLDLTSDPYEMAGNVTPFQVEMRRRTFWTLYPLYLSNDAYLPSGLLSPAGVSATTRPMPSSPTSSIFAASNLAVRTMKAVSSSFTRAKLDGLLSETDAFLRVAQDEVVPASILWASRYRLVEAATAVGITTHRTSDEDLDRLLRTSLSASTIPFWPDLEFMVGALAMSTATVPPLAQDQFMPTFDFAPPEPTAAVSQQSFDSASFATGLGLSSHTVAAPRPLLSVHTSVGTGGHLKTPSAVVSPWQDASQTPSRYVGWSWGSTNLF